jgi:nickel/cobalt transporter (NicO) family protein
VLPDHWVPLAVVGRTQHYSVVRIARLSGLAAVAHVLVSLILGTIIVLVGLQFRSSVQSAQDTIVGGLLIATGLGFALFAWLGNGHSHAHDHGHGHDHSHPRDPDQPERRPLLAVMVPFGAAASPDLTILPVFLAATTAGTGAAIGALVVFAAVTILTIVSLTMIAAVGSYQIKQPWLERWGNGITAGVLVLIGALVLAGVL